MLFSLVLIVTLFFGEVFCATLFPFILILSTGCLVLQSSCNKVHLRATTTSTHGASQFIFTACKIMARTNYLLRLLFCVLWKRNVTEDWNYMGSRELSRIRFMGFLYSPPEVTRSPHGLLHCTTVARHLRLQFPQSIALTTHS